MSTIEVIKDEADRKREGIREEIPATLRSSVLNPDARFRYRGGTQHPNRPDRIDYWKAQGYEVVPPDAKEGWEFGGRRDKEKGVQLKGDQVLLRTPVENYERRRKRARDREARRMGQVDTEARENINRIAREGDGKGHGRLARAHEDVAFSSGPPKDV